MPAWLKTPIDAALLRKLDGLTWDAHGVWSAMQRAAAANGEASMHRRKVPAAVARRINDRRLDAALAELVDEELLTVDADVYTHTVWHQPENDVWDDPVKRERWARNKRLHRDTELCKRIKNRDRNLCRYCGIRVNWSSRTGADSGTYDHVDPDGENTFGNVVVACRRCNGHKRDRTPDQANMPLLRAGIDTSTKQSMVDRGASPYLASSSTRARAPRADAPPGTSGSARAQPGPSRGRAALMRARETGPGRAGAEPPRPDSGHAVADLPGSGAHPHDDPDRLASLASCEPPPEDPWPS